MAQAELPGWKLLKKVKEREQRQADAAAAAAAPGAIALQLVEMMSSRCKNIEVSHIALHKCSAHEHVGGKPAHLVSPAFTAIGYRWKVYTVHDLTAGTYSAVLQIKDSRMPLPCDVFVCRGPSTDARIAAAVASHNFAPRHRCTGPLLLASAEVANTLGELDTLTLRIGLVARRAGRPNRDFSGVESGGAWGGGGGGAEDEEEGFDEMDSDMDGSGPLSDDGGASGSLSDSFDDEDDANLYGSAARRRHGHSPYY